MHKPFTTFLRLVLLALALGTGFTSQAQVTYSPVPLQASSFNADVISEGSAAVATPVPSSGTNMDVDGGGYYLLSKDYYTATTAHTSGIPNNGTIPNNQSGGPSYQLAAFTGNNSLRMPATNGASGTVSFVTATAAAEVYVMAICGGVGGSPNTANLSFTLTYNDGTTTTGLTGTYPDWFTSSPAQNVYGMSARANAGTPISVTTWSNSAPFFHQVKLTVPVGKVNSPISSITVTRTNSLGIVNIMAVSLGVYPVCSVAPTTQAQATTTSGGSTTLTTACSSTSIYLSLTGVPNSSGYTYQWQSSPDGTAWTNISGATSPTYTATGQLAATYYRSLVYCLYDSGSGATPAASGAVQVGQTPFGNCYCTPNRTSTTTTATNVTAVSLPGDGSTLSHAPGTITSASAGYVSNSYAVYPVGTATTTVAPGSTYTLSVTVPNSTRASAWIDYNQSGTFDTGEYYSLRTGANAVSSTTNPTILTVAIAVPAGALAGATRLRIRTEQSSGSITNTAAGACLSTTNGQSMDYTVTVAAPVACAGTPPAITLASSNAGPLCGGTAFTLTASGAAAGTTGLSYQFQSSPAGAGNFANLGAAQATATYTVSSQTAATDYRVVVTCTNSSLSATSNVTALAQSPFYNCYCTIAVPSGGANEYITSFGLPGTNGFTSTSNATPVPATPNGNSTGYSDYTTNPALTTTLYQGATYIGGVALSVRSNAANSAGGMWIDYNQNSIFEASEYIAIGGSSQTATIVSLNSDLTIPASALTGLTRVRVRWRNGAIAPTDACVTGSGNWFGEAEDYFITIAAPTTCSAPPASVTAATSVSNACANSSFTLSAVGIPTTLGGYTYQWQSSPAGAGTFADITGATTQTYVVSGQTVPTDYQLIVGCQYGGSPVTSNVASVGQNPFDQCYCAPAYTNGCGTYGQISNVQLNTLNYSSGCAAAPYYTVVPAGTATTTLNGGSTYTLRITNSNTSTFGVWIDYNQNGTFESTEFVHGATGSTGGVSTTITIPATAPSGATRMRVRTDSFTAFTSASNPCTTLNFGEAEDYTITIVAPSACAGTPSTTASATTASTCVGTSFTLSATNPGNASGLTYQWQSSPAGAGTFADITGATALTYTVASQTAATDYQVVVTCTASSQSVTSNVVAVAQSSFLNCYCLPTYTNTSSTGDGVARVVLGTLNNATGYNAPFTNYTTAQTGATPTLQIPDLVPGSSASVAVTFGTDGNQWGAVWIDFNQNGLFGDVANEYVAATSQTGNGGTYTFTLPVPLTALAGPTRMRVRGGEDGSSPSQNQACGASSSVYGEGEDYFVNILGTVACTGSPAATTATASAGAVCQSTPLTLNATGIAAATTGLTYQWQSSPAGAGTFANISGATTNPYTLTGQATATDYRLQVTCTASAQTTTSSDVAVGQNAFATCYGTPSGGDCTNEYIRSVTLNTLSNTATGCTGNGYNDYTANSAMTTTLNKGTAYTISLSLRINSNPAGAGIWIDYDHSGSFEASEYVSVYGNTAAASNLDVSGSVSFTVPASALTGATRMRVRSANSTVPISATAAVPPSPYYGEVEDYLVTIAAPLPVKLISFAATAQENAVRLNWATASELHSERFDVERSADGKTFERIGTVAAQGTSTRRVDYEFLDTKALAKAATRYYRLRQVDTDGTAEYSPVRSVQTTGITHLELYPNPAHRALSVTGAAAGAAVEIFDALGRTILTAPANADGQARLTLPASLPSGVYIVRSGTETRRLTVE
jgi:hypothetical protein